MIGKRKAKRKSNTTNQHDTFITTACFKLNTVKYTIKETFNDMGSDLKTITNEASSQPKYKCYIFTI